MLRRSLNSHGCIVMNEGAPHYVFNVLLSKVLQKLLFSFVPRLSAKFKASLPAGVMSPRSSRSMHRSILSLVQWLFFLLGDSLWASLPSGSFFSVLSIHPKQSASSTTSIYGSMPCGGVLLLLMTTQHSFSLEWFSFSHALSCDRSEYSNSVVISIVSHEYFMIVPLRV